MNTKILIAATVAAMSLATTAFAGGEGAGDPFPYHTPGITSSGGVDSPANRGVTAAFDNTTLPENGAEGAVQTANSLPRGFENGTVAYMEAQSVNRWYAQQAEHRFAQSHQAQPHG